MEMFLRVQGRAIVSANFTIYDCNRVAHVAPSMA